MSSLDTRGAFLCDDGLRLLLWCGGDLAPEIAAQLQTNEKVGNDVMFSKNNNNISMSDF